MAVSYRLPGIIADLALTIYAATTFALFKLIPVTLALDVLVSLFTAIFVTHTSCTWFLTT